MNSDFWIEIYEDMMRKPSRTILTCIGIAWGIFILVVLVGTGTGFQKGVMNVFNGFAKNTTYVYAGKTSKNYKNTGTDKPITFKMEDIDMLRNSVDEIEFLSPEVGGIANIFSGTKVGQYQVKGVNDEYFAIKNLNVEMGRTLNSIDSENNKRVVVIGKNVADVLFKGEQPLGKYLRIELENYKVVGIVNNTLQNPYEEQLIYVPYSAYVQVNPSARDFTTMLYSFYNGADVRKSNDRVKCFLARKHEFAPDDEDALYFNSMEEQMDAFNQLFASIQKFLWFMGFSTLLSGIIGAGNIMYTTARERTREIGIRKAIGASISSIKQMFLLEAISLTTVSGLIGMIMGEGVLVLIGKVFIDDNSLIEKPTVDLPTGIAAIIILVISGTIIGLRPAVYASKLNAIDALREEN